MSDSKGAQVDAGTMKAVRFHGKEDLRYEDLPSPTKPGKGMVKIKPAWCGICGTDLHEYLGGPSICPTTAHPLTNEAVPLVFGHEFSGTIEEVGEGVSSDLRPGDRVCVQPILYCGECGACKDGAPNCCWSNGFVGLSGWGGGLSESLVCPAYCAIKIPDNVGLDVAALVEPLAVGFHSVNISPYKPGDSVLILGGGPIGLAVIQAIKAKGAGTIIVSEVAEKRKHFAKEFGATHILDPRKDDIVARCREICDGQGVHVAFDAAGVQSGLDQAIHAVRALGTIVNIAIWEKPCTIFPNDFIFKEKKYVFAATYVHGDFQQVLEAISTGKIDPKNMITKRINMDEVLEEGFMTLINNKNDHVKILVKSAGGQ